ncbi:MAG: DUF4435 domain-containing protein [Alphaproteobacteria bacterium]
MNNAQFETSGSILANEVRLLRAVRDGSFFLVEGYSDKKLFEKFSDDSCSVIECMGKGNLFDAITILVGENFSGVLGFSDKDYDDQIDCSGSSDDGVLSHMVFTDENDMEISILCSPALTNMLREYGKTELTIQEEHIQEIIFSVAAPIGILRMLNPKRGWKLLFRDMIYHFKGEDSFEIDLFRTVKHIFQISESPNAPNLEDLCEHVKCCIKNTDSTRSLCNGHDCVRILGRVLKCRFGGTDCFDSKGKAIELGRILRLSYEYAFFQETRAYKSIREWETRNEFLVLKSVS